MLRVSFLTFHGRRAYDEHKYTSMNRVEHAWPLVALAVTVRNWRLGSRACHFGRSGLFTTSDAGVRLARRPEVLSEAELTASKSRFAVVAAVSALLGLGIAYWLYLSGRKGGRARQSQ